MGGANWQWTFVLITVLMGGGAAYASGKAMAQTWRPFWHVPLYMLVLAAVVRFCHFALFEEPLLSAVDYLVDFAVAFAAGSLGYRLSRARQMAVQYGWLFRRRGPFGWRSQQ
jgi:predicted permease